MQQGGTWSGHELEVDEQGRLIREGRAVYIEHSQMLLSLHIRVTEKSERMNTYGAGDFDRADLKLQVTPELSKAAWECKVEDMYRIFNRTWARRAKTAGLDRMTAWVQAAGYKGNLLWLIVHAAVRLGCRELAETRARGEAVHRDKFNCPVCGFGSSGNMAEGETLDHAYGSHMTGTGSAVGVASEKSTVKKVQ